MRGNPAPRGIPKTKTPPPKQTMLGKKLREYRKQLRNFGKRKG